MTFENVRMTEEEQKMVNGWLDDDEFLRLKYPSGLITDHTKSMTADRDLGFYMIDAGWDSWGVERNPDPTYYRYLRWKDGCIHIHVKEERIDGDENFYKENHHWIKETIITFIKFDLVRNDSGLKKDYLIKIVKEASDIFGVSPSPSRYSRKATLDFSKVQLTGAWEE